VDCTWRDDSLFRFSLLTSKVSAKVSTTGLVTAATATVRVRLGTSIDRTGGIEWMEGWIQSVLMYYRLG
jgi:hypothetical protein